jgi:signal transduction histidine kinase
METITNLIQETTMKLSIGLKLIGAQFALTLLAMLMVSASVAGGLLRWLPGYEGAERLWACGLAAALACLLGWAAARLSLLPRLWHAVEVSQAWLRGDLSLRIEDHAEDELGILADQSDQLVQQLAHDEQDLAELRQREARLSDQVRALSVLEERNRLARELHDGVKQHLFSLSMTASALQDRQQADPNCMAPDLAEMIGQIKLTAQTAQREMTLLIEGLRPASLQEHGLGQALNDYCLLFGAREHLLIYLDAQGSDNLLSPSVAEALYIITQEALANVARHARATRIDVKLRVIPEQVTLTVRDNGAGFDQSQPRQGLGVSNMHERLLALGGRLTIRSEMGHGTLVTAEIGLARPLPAPRPFSRLDESCPIPEISNWAWLGQKLVIPVGQTWPWLPADEAHLRQPLIEPQAITANTQLGWLGLGREITLRAGEKKLVRVSGVWGGYTWRVGAAWWQVRTFGGQWAILRNGQPVSGVQYQGRQMNRWSEFIYAGRGYRLAANGTPGTYQLTDEDGQEIAQFDGHTGLEITLHRPMPLTLLVVAALRLLHEKKMVIHQ